MSQWKQFERDAAGLFGGARFWANSGERLDFEGTFLGQKIRGQCKNVQRLSLEALTKLAEEQNVDVVCVKVRRGRGKPSPMLIVFTESSLQRLLSGMISSTATTAPCACSEPSPRSKHSVSSSLSLCGQSLSSEPLEQAFLLAKQLLSQEQSQQ